MGNECPSGTYSRRAHSEVINNISKYKVNYKSQTFRLFEESLLGFYIFSILAVRINLSFS